MSTREKRDTLRTVVRFDETPDGKLRRAERCMVQARAMMKAARALASEAGVPRVAALALESEDKASEAIGTARVAMFDDDDVSDDRPTRPMARTA